MMMADPDLSKYAALLGWKISQDDDDKSNRSSEEERPEPRKMNEKDVEKTCVGLARLQVHGDALQKKIVEEQQEQDQEDENENIPTRPEPMDIRTKTLSALPNLIIRDRLFRSTANDQFLTRLLQEPPIQTIYMQVKRWVMMKKEFKNGQNDIITQLTRLGVHFVASRQSQELDDSYSRDIYIEFLLDPFHKQKMEEKKKKEEDMDRKRTLRRIARSNKDDRYLLSSESESSTDEDAGPEPIFTENVLLESMMIDIEEEEIPGFVEERVHFDVILHQTTEKTNVKGLQFYIVNVQK